MAKNQRGRIGVRLILLAGIGVVVITVLALSLFYGGRNPQDPHRKVGDSFMDAIIDSDSQASFGLLTQSTQQEIGGQENWNSLLEAGDFNETEARYKFEEAEAVNDADNIYGPNSRARHLYYTFSVRASSPYTIRLTVVDQDGDLKISEYNSKLKP